MYGVVRAPPKVGGVFSGDELRYEHFSKNTPFFQFYPPLDLQVDQKCLVIRLKTGLKPVSEPVEPFSSRSGFFLIFRFFKTGISR